MTIVIEQAEIRLTSQQLANALRQLSPDELESVLRELALPTWEERFDTLLARVRERAQQSPLTDDEINTEVEQARAEFPQGRS